MRQVPASHALIILGHNGPAGLGSQRHNICGCDWLAAAGDHGDPDLQEVLQQLHRAGRAPSLVVFGHMHYQLQGLWQVLPGLIGFAGTVVEAGTLAAAAAATCSWIPTVDGPLRNTM
jgi:hypothetical protein